eukprot:m.368868 g.368868  ORF g.368868 m.368868 type:complete len:63 (-) comp20844_c0_seq1:1530-1718(-)
MNLKDIWEVFANVIDSIDHEHFGQDSSPLRDFRDLYIDTLNFCVIETCKRDHRRIASNTECN